MALLFQYQTLVYSPGFLGNQLHEVASDINIFISSYLFISHYFILPVYILQYFYSERVKNFKTREYTPVGLQGTYKNLLLIENLLVSKAFKCKTRSVRLSL